MAHTTIPTEPVVVSDDVLARAEEALDRAIATRDASGLHVLGFGEVSVAIGWPTDSPEYVLQRVLVYDSRASCEAHFAQIETYLETIRAGGADVLVTSLHIVDRPDGRASGWISQPLLAKELLATTILGAAEPSADHPVVLAHREVARRDCSSAYAVDLQISNFAYDGERYVLFDITSPLTWDADGEFTGPIPDEYVRMTPAPIRPVFRKEYAKAASDFQTLRGAFHGSLVWLHRAELANWAPAFAEAFNELVDEPLDVAAARSDFERFKKVIPMVKRTSRLQRWWQTTVRRQPYDAFITDSFSGELL